MDKQAEFVLRTVEERDIRFVRLWFTDILGALKSVAIAPAELEGAFTEGIGFDTIYDRFRNVHRYIKSTGTAGDGDNNLVILDYDPPTDLTQDNFLGHFVYGIDARHVETVISKGEVLVEDRKITTVDEKEVLQYAREMGRKLWDKL